MSEDIISKFEQEQQRLFDSFKIKMKQVCENTLSDLYTDVVNYADTDAHINYHNFLRDEFRQSFVEEITSKNGHYSWAHDIRMKILEQHKDVLQNKIITDLQDRIKSLEEQIEQMRRWR